MEDGPLLPMVSEDALVLDELVVLSGRFAMSAQWPVSSQ